MNKMQKFVAHIVFLTAALLIAADFSPNFIVKGAPWYDVRAFSTLQTALTAIGETERTLLIFGTVDASHHEVIPPNVHTWILGSGKFQNNQVGPANAFTINGPLTAPEGMIFTGPGTVVFGSMIREVHPAWFGTLGTADDTATVTKALEATSAGQTLVLPARTLLLSGISVADKPNIAITGSTFGSILKLKDGGNATVFTATRCDNLRLSNFKIDGNKAEQSDSTDYTNYSGIFLADCNNAIVDNLIINDVRSGRTDAYNTSLRSASWHWEPSAFAGAFYLVDAYGELPSTYEFQSPVRLYMKDDGVNPTEHSPAASVSALTAYHWFSGRYAADNLANDTVYVYLPGAVDPDSKAAGWLTADIMYAEHSAVRFYGCTNSVVRNCFIDAPEHCAVSISWGYRCRVEGGYFTNVGETAVSVMACPGSRVQDLVVIDTAMGTSSVAICSNTVGLKITNCYVAQTAVTRWGLGTSKATIYSVGHNNNNAGGSYTEIINCTGISQDSIVLYVGSMGTTMSSMNVKVLGGYFTAANLTSDYGIRVDGSNAMLSNLTLSGISIGVFQANAQIDGCQIQSAHTDRPAIDIFAGGAGSSVINNRILNSAKGIRLVSTLGVMLALNNIYSGTTGIDFYGTTASCFAQMNTLRTMSYAGINSNNTVGSGNYAVYNNYYSCDENIINNGSLLNVVSY